MNSGTGLVESGGPSAVCGPGQRRARLRNVGPVAVRVGDRTVTWESGFLLAPGEVVEVVGFEAVYAIAPPGVFPQGRGRLDWIAE